MAARTRKYQGKSVDEMRAIAAANSGDKTILKEIAAELEVHRKTNAAKRLLAELNSGKPVEAKPAASEGSKNARRTVQDEPVAVFDGCKELKARYDALRATFSERGEILSRWGMTDALPAEMAEVLAQMWAKRVGEDEDAAGRSCKKLRADMTYLGIRMELPGTTTRRRTHAE